MICSVQRRVLPPTRVWVKAGPLTVSSTFCRRSFVSGSTHRGTLIRKGRQNAEVRGPEAALSPEAPSRLPGYAAGATE